MLKSKLKIALVLFISIILISGLSFATSQTPTETTSEQVVTDSQANKNVDENNDRSSWTNADLFICEDNVVVDNVVDGNAFIIGKDVKITGEIGGDLFVLAEKLEIDGGFVYSSLFACAKEIVVNGTVYDIYSASGSFTLGEDGYVYRDLRACSDTININGNIKRDVFVAANTYKISEDAYIGGNLEYEAESDISVSKDVVNGEINRKVPEKNEKAVPSIGSKIASYVSDLVKSIVYTLVVVILLLWLAPKFVNRIGQMSVGKSFASLGIGLGAIFGTVIGGIILLITLIGVPLAFTLVLVLSILWSISFAVTSLFFSKLFTKNKELSNVKFVLITLAVSAGLWVICKLPIIGGLASACATFFGIGATLVNMVCRKEKQIEEAK